LNTRCVFDFLYNFYLKHFSFEEELSEIASEMSSGLHVECPHCCPVLIKLGFLTDFQKILKYKNT
jgi:hypothetical protein